jgi:hypothetical protein
MLFENIRVYPIEMKNQLTGEMKILLPGEIMDLPEALGKMYYNYLKPVMTESQDVELFVEDIQSEIVSEFNMSGDLHSPVSEENGDIIEAKETISKIMNGENVLLVEEEVVEKKPKGRPKVYDGQSSAEKRKLQRQKKKENDAKFKDLKF